MTKHWYRNDQLNKNKLITDGDPIPEGFTREAYRNFQSEIQQGEKHNNWGKHHSEETKRKIGEAQRGKFISEETRKKMSTAAKARDYSNFHPDHRGEKNPRYKNGKPLSPEVNKQFQLKRYQTMKENGTFNTSKPEELYYKKLLETYAEDDIIRQYKSEAYPFACDFYIISEDKYIECHYNWTHGGRPFISTDPSCIEQLERWESKTNGHDYYANAIKTWTDLDVRKRAVAEENKLNIEFIYDQGNKSNTLY